MDILWSTIEFMKMLTRHDLLLDQRQASNKRQMQSSTSQSGNTLAFNPERARPPSVQSLIVPDETNSPEPETQNTLMTKSNLASAPLSTPQPSGSSGPSVSNSTLSVVVATQMSRPIAVVTQNSKERARPPKKVKKTEKHWKYLGVSVIGAKHIKKAMPCQDACRCKALPTGELVIVVADGAGSAPRAQEGASLVVGAAVNYLSEAISKYKPNTATAWEEVIRHSFELARAGIIEHALDQTNALKDYATTLQIVIAANDWTISALIGDGTAIGLVNNNLSVSLMTPQKGEYANATNFITNASWLDKLDVQVWSEPVSGVAVLTDGLLNLAINEQDNTPFPQFFSPLFKFLDASTSQRAKNHLIRFLESDRINRKTDDDKTLVLARRMARHGESEVGVCDSKQMKANQ